MRKLLTLMISLLAIAAPAYAQITTPFTFTAGTVANPDEVNSNFAKFADALNRTGGTMTGTLTSQQITPSASNTYDLGSAAALFRSGYLRTSLVFGQAAGNYTLTWANPAAARAISIADPGGTDVFTFNAATQTLTNKTLTAPAISAPVLSGTATGTYTLAGTPTITAPAISSPVLSGTATGTYTLGGTPTIASPILSGTVTGTYTIGGTPTFPATVPLTNAANSFTAAQTVSITDAGVGTKTLGLTIARVGASTSSTERQIGLAFSDANNATLVGGVAGVRQASSGNYLGDLAFYVHNTSGSAATDFSGLNEAGRFNAAGNLILNGLLNANGVGTHSVGGGGTVSSSSLTVNGGNATGAGANLSIQKNAASTILIGHLSAILGSGTSNDLALFAPASAAIGLYTNGSTAAKWGVSSAGDFTVGASSHIALSNGTPAVSTGFGAGATVTGSDYAFTISLGTGANTGGTINFGHTWSTAPVCTGSLNVQGNIKSGAVNGFNFSGNPTTTQMFITYDSVAAPAQLFYIHCFGT